MIVTCNEEYWKYMEEMRDRTPGAPCGKTFDDAERRTICPHEELPPYVSAMRTAIEDRVEL